MSVIDNYIRSAYGDVIAFSPLLYVLNTEGLPISARPSEASAGSSRAQLDLLHQKEHLFHQLQDNVQRTAASIAGLSTVLSGSARLQAEAVPTPDPSFRVSDLPTAESEL
ncbi:hypothetical protein BGY98DRAFT_1183925 [Russula aff. rugulosa BPL654]|nr:hypothetical protein BGY98DRAFT_1183925 [Russula aff. rugulosa BPL654]